MKIAFDYQTFSLQPYGGISRYFSKIICKILSMGHEAKVFAPFHRNRHLLDIPKSAISGHFFDHYPRKTTRIFYEMNRYLSLKGISKWRPDIIHETYYSQNSPSYGGAPVVLTVYDMIHELFAYEMDINDPTSNNKKEAVRRADMVICISNKTRDDLLNYYDVNTDKVKVVYLGFEDFQTRGLRQESALDLKPFLLYVGNRHGYKNFQGLVRAIALSPRLMLDFDLISFGGEPFNMREQDLFRQLGFRENQIQHITGDDSILAHLYSKARGFVYPSIYEGFGMPPLEAMAYDCPVIASNSSCIPEIVGSAGEYFSPLDIEEIRHSIEAVVYSDTRSQELKKLGRERVKIFTWDRCAKETLEIYKNLI